MAYTAATVADALQQDAAWPLEHYSACELYCWPCAVATGLSCCLQTWAGQPGNWEAAQKVLLSLAAVNSQAQLGQYKGPHPSPGGGRILQASCCCCWLCCLARLNCGSDGSMPATIGSAGMISFNSAVEGWPTC